MLSSGYPLECTAVRRCGGAGVRRCGSGAVRGCGGAAARRCGGAAVREWGGLAGGDRDRYAVQRGGAGEGVGEAASVTSFALAPATWLATVSRAPGRPWPKPCGRLTTPGIMSLLAATSTATDPAADVTATS